MSLRKRLIWARNRIAGEVGGERDGLFQLGLGLLDVTRLYLGESELMPSERQSGLGLDDRLEMLDSLVRLSSGQMQPAAQHQAVQIRRTLLEERI